MNNKLSKKVRKEVNQQLIKNYNQVYENLLKENILRRMLFAFRILVKSKKKIKFEMRH